MERKLFELVKNVRDNVEKYFYDGMAIKDSAIRILISKILDGLKWMDWNSDVKVNYKCDDIIIDYVFRKENIPILFLKVEEVKELYENYKDKVIQCAYKNDVNFIVLTNGLKWLFYAYLPDENEHFLKIKEVDLLKDDVKESISGLISLLSRDSIMSGAYFEKIKYLYKQAFKSKESFKILLKIWEKVVSEPDEFLIDILEDEARKSFDYSISKDIIRDFLKKLAQNESVIRPHLFEQKSEVGFHISHAVDYNGKKIEYFIFNGEKRSVKKWQDFFVQVVNMIYELHKDEFERALKLKGGKGKPFFSRTPEKDNFHTPKRLGNSNIFFDSTRTNNDMVKFCRRLLLFFGHDENELEVYVTDK